MASKKAYVIVSMGTLLKPFDGIVWAAICALICVQTTLLVIIRKILTSLTSPGKLGNDHFEGIEC